MTAFETLPGTLDQVWQRLQRGVADRRAPARHPVLATAGINGGAEARVVVLRGADRSAGTLEVHTDTASGKIAELRADPRATLLVWDPRARLQIRLRVSVEIQTGAEAAPRWNRVPDRSRLAYGGTPAPGQPLSDPAEHLPEPDIARFAVLIARIDQIETLHLGEPRHRRAKFDRENAWAGIWIAP